MSDELENLIHNIANDLETPGVEKVHELAASRKLRKHAARNTVGITAIIAVVAGIAFLFLEPRATELATGDATLEVSPTVAADSAPKPVIDTRVHQGDLQRRLISTPRWFAIERIGIPESAFPESEIISFTKQQVGFSNCKGISYDITWMVEDGFSVDRPTPIDPNAEVPAIGCPEPADGMLLASITSGLEVRVEANPDGTIRLTSPEWEVLLSANPSGDEKFIYRSLALDDAASLAEARGLEWREVRADDQPLDIDDGFVPGRVNFTTRDGYVIHVRTDDEVESSHRGPIRKSTTTTIAPPDESAPTGGVPAGSMDDVLYLQSADSLFHGNILSTLPAMQASRCPALQPLTTGAGFDVFVPEAFEEFVETSPCGLSVVLRTDGSITVFGETEDERRSALAKAAELGLNVSVEAG